ncbi:MAG: hypothetical protein GX552_15840 [Chloroflexi bacterium]|jgi:hypothetical protein|nr:hypothetical protein [Chloroflexota bacterium]
MQTHRARYVLGLVIAVAICLVAVWWFAKPAQASLGNTGTPVYGNLVGPLPQSEQRYVRFFAADGTPFKNGDMVPDGKYLLITDILVTPDGGTDAAAVISVDLEVGGQSIRLRSTDNGTLNMHFTTPYFILRGGERLRVTNAWFSNKWVYVNVSGVLVSNVNYVPLALGD